LDRAFEEIATENPDFLLLGSRLDQDQNATTLAKATAEAKLAASLS
jgi:hypothetical protein